jgi:hypothetical protein
VDEYDKVQVTGKTVADRLRQIVELTELLTGVDLVVTQGSYNEGVGPSGGTHDQGGAVDLSVHGHSQPEVESVIQTLRQLGCAAWHRFPNQGKWPEHMHAVDSGAKDLSDQAEWQVGEYNAGRNGLLSQQSESGHIPLVPYVYAPGDIVKIELSQAQIEAGIGAVAVAVQAALTDDVITSAEGVTIGIAVVTAIGVFFKANKPTEG